MWSWATEAALLRRAEMLRADRGSAESSQRNFESFEVSDFKFASSPATALGVIVDGTADQFAKIK